MAVGSRSGKGVIVYSEDGVEWTEVKNPPSFILTDVAYGNGRFVTISNQNSVSDKAAYSGAIGGGQGEPGVGVPAGGSAGQFLAKESSSDYTTHWVDPPAGGGSGVTSFNSRTGTITPASGDYSAAQILFSSSLLQSNNVQGAINELFQSVSNGKSLIASAITDMGIKTAKDATFQQMHNNILEISKLPDDVHQIELSVDPSDAGKVSGGGYASAGMTCNAKAVSSGKYIFDAWYENHAIVSNNEEYSF